MRSLIFSHVAAWPAHHAESVEIALSQRAAGNEVIYLSCTGALASCPANPGKLEHICRECRVQTLRTTSRILPDDIRSMDLQIEEHVYVNQIFDSIESLKCYKLYGVPFGAMVYNILITEYNDSFFDVAKYPGRINEVLNNSIGLYHAALNIIEKEKIDRVFVWNGRRSCDGPLTYAASANGIVFSVFISGGKYNTILHRDGVHLVQDIESTKKELKNIICNFEVGDNKFYIFRDAIKYFDYAAGRNQDKEINYLGYYQFSKSFERSENKSIKRDPGKKIIAIFAGTYSEFAGVPGYDGTGEYCENFYDGISFLQDNIQQIPDSQMIIRWHPNSKKLNGNEKLKLNSIIARSIDIRNVTHIAPESNFNTYALIQECDVVVGFGTSVSIEACLYGKPVIFMGHNMFEDLDCFYKPTSFSDLILLLNSKLEAKNFDHAIAWGYYWLNRGNNKYEFLQQVRPNIFYYGDKRLLPSMVFYRRIVAGLKNKILKFLSFTK